jgi:hypothetical protein
MFTHHVLPGDAEHVIEEGVVSHRPQQTPECRICKIRPVRCDVMVAFPHIHTHMDAMTVVVPAQLMMGE